MLLQIAGSPETCFCTASIFCNAPAGVENANACLLQPHWDMKAAAATAVCSEQRLHGTAEEPGCRKSPDSRPLQSIKCATHPCWTSFQLLCTWTSL